MLRFVRDAALNRVCGNRQPRIRFGGRAATFCPHTGLAVGGEAPLDTNAPCQRSAVPSLSFGVRDAPRTKGTRRPHGRMGARPLFVWHLSRTSGVGMRWGPDRKARPACTHSGPQSARPPISGSGDAVAGNPVLSGCRISLQTCHGQRDACAHESPRFQKASRVCCYKLLTDLLCSRIRLATSARSDMTRRSWVLMSRTQNATGYC